MSSPRVSFVMSVRNGAPLLKPQLESLTAQTFRDWELILIDDGSTDATPQVARNHRDDRVRYERREPGNLVDRFNEGIALARGELIARVDGDDVTMPTRLEEQVAFLDANPQVVAVGSRMLEIDPYGVPLGETDHAPDHEEIERRLLRGSGWSLPHPVATYRKTHANQIGGYRRETRWVEDLDFFLRLARVGRLANLQKILVQYRRHLGSVNSQQSQKQLELQKMVLADARRERGLPESGEVAEPRTEAPVEKRLSNWMWNALRHGRRDAARKHAWQHLRLHPTSGQSWKLLACALRGR